MNVLISLSLWLAVMMSSCCGDTGSHEHTTSDYEYDYEATTAPVYDYDYTATFDYYYVTGLYPPKVYNKAAGIGRISPVLLLGLAVHQIWN